MIMRDYGQEFECYSPRLQGWFQSKGIRYERIFIHNRTNRKCWVYKMDRKLSAVLKHWSNTNPNDIFEKAS